MLKFGIEIEAYNVASQTVADAITAAGLECYVEGYNHRTRPHWKVVSDASISGRQAFELVSPILYGDNGLDQVRTVCRVLNELGAKVNRSCGLHVHHDAAGMKEKHLDRLVVLYAQSENFLDTLMPASRRGDTVRYVSSIRGLGDTNQELSNHGRYHKLNVTSFRTRGTIEFRHHSGTTDAEKIVNWVLLTDMIMKRTRRPVKKYAAQHNYNWHEFFNLSGLRTKIRNNEAGYAELKTYIVARRKHFQIHGTHNQFANAA